MNKQAIINSLYTYAHKRPGLEFADYGNVACYRSDVRSITRDLHEARHLLRYVEMRDSITADMILEAARSAFSGRLTINPDATISYCTGQYWPTEYRKAVCAVLASAIWHYLRDAYKGDDDLGEKIRKAARREFDRSICKRWFA